MLLHAFFGQPWFQPFTIFLFFSTSESIRFAYNTRRALRYTRKTAIRPTFLHPFCKQLLVLRLRIGQAPVSEKGRNLIRIIRRLNMPATTKPEKVERVYSQPNMWLHCTLI